MSAEIANLNLKSIKSYQDEIHKPINLDEDIDSPFTGEYRKSTWMTQLPVPLMESGNSRTRTFTVHSTFHFLMGVNLRQKFPVIKVKDSCRDTVQICYCHNLGTNIVESAVMKIGDDTVQNLDPCSYDVSSQYNMKPGFREHYDRCVGNCDLLEKWTTILPEYTTNVPQPWYFRDSRRLAYPICLDPNSKVTFTYTFRSILDLLRCRYRKTVDDPWMDVSAIDISGFLEPFEKLEPAQLWGQYAQIDNEELRYHKEAGGSPNPEDVKHWKADHTYWIRNFITVTSSNPVFYSTTEKLNLQCITPCLAVFWCAENVEAFKNHNYSNYTTNKEDLYSGWNPCGSVTLNHSTKNILDDLDPDHFELNEVWNSFRSAPSEPGYNVFPFTRNPFSDGSEVGIIFNGLDASLAVKIVNSEPFTKENKSKVTTAEDLLKAIEASLGQTTPQQKSSHLGFRVQIRMLVLRKLSFAWSKDGCKAELDKTK